MILCGIDPGAKGGIAFIPLYDFQRTYALPLEAMTLYDIHAIFQEYRGGGGIFSSKEKDRNVSCKGEVLDVSNVDPSDYQIDTAVEVYLEEPQLPAHNGHSGTNFNVQAHKGLARSIGQLEGICIANGYPPNLLSPQKWQNYFGCSTGGDKTITLELAKEAFPFLSRTTKVLDKQTKQFKKVSTVTHAIADALMIALYAYLQYAEKIPNSVAKALTNQTDTSKLPKSPKHPRAKLINLLKEQNHAKRPILFKQRN